MKKFLALILSFLMVFMLVSCKEDDITSIINNFITTTEDKSGQPTTTADPSVQTTTQAPVVQTTTAGGEAGTTTTRPSSQGGEGEVPTDSRFVNKKLVTITVETTPSNSEANEVYLNSYASLFMDGTFELVATYYGVTRVLVGTYTISADDLVATLTSLKTWDSQEGYGGIEDAFEQTTITYSEGKYYIQFTNGLIFKLTLDDGGEQPVHFDLPNDPNAQGDAKYHVTEELWNSIMFNHALLGMDQNYTLSYPIYYGALVNSVIKKDGVKIELVGEPYSTFYDVKSATNADYYYFDSTTSNTWKKQNMAFDAVFSFEENTGVLPIDFEDMSFSSSSEYYYKSSFRKYYDKENDPTNYVDYSNIKVYFLNNVLQKITYTSLGQNFVFEYTNIGTTTVTLPTLSGGVDVNDYLNELYNKQFAFKEATGSNMSNAEKPTYEGATLSFFKNENKAEFAMIHTFFNGAVEDGNTTLIGQFSLRKNSYNINNNDPYIIGDFKLSTSIYNGNAFDISSENESMPFRYFIDSKTIRLQLDDGQFLWFDVTTKTPVESVIPEPSKTIKYMLGDGTEFELEVGEDGLGVISDFTCDAYTTITFMINYEPISGIALDATVPYTTAYATNGTIMFYKAGTYDIELDTLTNTVYITGEIAVSADSFLIMDYNMETTYKFVSNPENSDEIMATGIGVSNAEMPYQIVKDYDWFEGLTIARESADYAQLMRGTELSIIQFKATGTYNVYLNTETLVLRVEVAS